MTDATGSSQQRKRYGELDRARGRMSASEQGHDDETGENDGGRQ
jgi:hypothetical protein